MLQGLEMGWRELPAGVIDTQKEVVPKQNTCFATEKHTEDVKQDQKIDLDFVESIVKAPGLVKDKLRRTLM